MIVDRRNRLMDRAALSLWLRRSPSMITKWCTPVACDVASHNQLYSVPDCEALFVGKPRRKAEQEIGKTHRWLEPAPAPDPRKAGRRRR